MSASGMSCKGWTKGVAIQSSIRSSKEFCADWLQLRAAQASGTPSPLDDRKRLVSEIERNTMRMEPMSHQPQPPMFRPVRIFQLIFIGLVSFLLHSPLTKATSVGSGSVRAELFHRDHPFSRRYHGKSYGHAENPRGYGGRSSEHSEALMKTRLSVGSSSLSNTTGPVTWEANITDRAPYEYLISISLGTPPQNFVAVADTGSDLTWVQCQPCDSCFSQPDRFFDPSLSSTYQNLSCSSLGCRSFNIIPSGETCNSCQYSYYYGDTSTTAGAFSSETITLESTTGQNVAVPDFWFGCSHTTSSPSGLYDSSDGIVGLAQGPISLSSQLGRVFENKFSYCLVNRSLASVQSSPLVFGKDAARPDMVLQYTPILNNTGLVNQVYYYIGLEGISVDGVAVNFNATDIAINSTSGSGGVILDSGTTYTYLNPVAFGPLHAAIIASLPTTVQRVSSPPSDVWSGLECYSVSSTPDYRDTLPKISLKLANNTSWDLAVENVWIQSTVDNQTICVTIVNGTVLDGLSIIGNTLQRDFHVLYDRVENRIGFAKTNCGIAIPSGASTLVANRRNLAMSMTVGLLVWLATRHVDSSLL